jgi:ABC-type nitrate/sulfonate/bicarbonate transport system substrate-binding protein
MTQPEIKTAEQLKGGRVAVARFGGAADFVARYALPRLGLIPGKDVTIVQTGGTPERLAALEARRVTGSTLVPPAMFTAHKKGFHLLADVAALGLAYQHQGGVTTRKFCASIRWSCVILSRPTSKPCTGSSPTVH